MQLLHWLSSRGEAHMQVPSSFVSFSSLSKLDVIKPWLYICVWYRAPRGAKDVRYIKILIYRQGAIECR